ncbi:MAG: Fic family protein [Nanoarchaeota archaeon]|nr:Fic family protein [Nanoarchaeota archaeon]MBU4456383.1 Fic family protein [Nanoarchaeota archaeon]MCG2720025.1 Fic family protein [Nanoarchaeota archaeon]
MVFIEKYKSKGITYYRLVHNIRKGNKIIQKKKQLGKILPPEVRVEYLKKEFLKEIAKDRYKYLSQKAIWAVENKREQYRKEIKRLSLLEKEKKLKEFIIRFTYDSSKLSGVDITLRQTSLILKEGIMPQNIRDLRTAKELENHEKGIIIITKYKGNFDIKFINKLHKVLFFGVDDTIAGKLRNEFKRNVKIAGTSYVPPKWQDLQRELKAFFKWYKSENKKLHPLELAALIHLKLISIQPFADGNSRLSRLLMNWVLWKKNYPPIDIPIEDLENYYDVLDKYQIEKKEKPFVEYILKWFLKSN